MLPDPNPQPVLEMLKSEDVMQLATVLDRQVQVLVDWHEKEAGYVDLSTQVHVLRLMRDALLESAGWSWK